MPARFADIVEWAAHASPTKVLAFWDNTVCPHKQARCWEQLSGKPIPLCNSQRPWQQERLDTKHAQCVRDHLAMSATLSHLLHQMGGIPSPSSACLLLPTWSSPSHPPTNMGGSKGLMAPSPTMQRVAKPSMSLAQQTPAHPMATASSNAPSSPPTPGGGATAVEHHDVSCLERYRTNVLLARLTKVRR
jgi:hypothetical protein